MGNPYWQNTNLDRKLGIVMKFYPDFCAPYDTSALEATHNLWRLCVYLSVDDKFYVIDRLKYSELTRAQLHEHRIGPYETLDDAALAAALLDERDM